MSTDRLYVNSIGCVAMWLRLCYSTGVFNQWNTAVNRQFQQFLYCFAYRIVLIIEKCFQNSFRMSNTKIQRTFLEILFVLLFFLNFFIDNNKTTHFLITINDLFQFLFQRKRKIIVFKNSKKRVTVQSLCTVFCDLKSISMRRDRLHAIYRLV